MNSRHIALIGFAGFAASSFLATMLPGCSAAETAKPVAKKTDGGTTTTGTTTSGAGGAGSMLTTGGGSGTDVTTSGAGGAGSMLAGGGGAPVDPATCMMNIPVGTGVLAMDMISDLEMGAGITSVTPPGGWYSYQDPTVGATLLPGNGAAFMPEAVGAMGTAMAVHVVGAGFSGVPGATSYGGGVGISLAGDLPVDMSAYKGITFWAKSGAIPSAMVVAVAMTSTVPKFCECLALGCYNSHAYLIGATGDAGGATPLPNAWTQYTVKWTDLKQADYGYKVAFDPTKIIGINFTSNGPVAKFDYWVDEVAGAR